VAERLRDSSDRLPWLTEVPRPESAPARPAARRSLPLLAFLLGALLTLIGVGAYWLGNRQGTTEPSAGERPGMIAQAETSAEAEAAAAAAAAAAEPMPLDPDVPEPAATAPALSRSPAAAGARPRAAAAQPARQAAVRRAAPRPRVARRQAEPDEEAGAPVALQPVVRGRIIQTGAFASRAQAEAAWQRMVAKWPYLATKPRLIAPLEVHSTDGKATRMFRVQLATASQAQSEVICQRLQSARQSCVVVY